MNKVIPLTIFLNGQFIWICSCNTVIVYSSFILLTPITDISSHLKKMRIKTMCHTKDL